ncbi:MAG TPA: hypothetical protein VF017_14540 [Thermoanaerobaculia bacterium]|nr:hypothetical protein [Thermoanaerobaculia bacterium]
MNDEREKGHVWEGLGAAGGRPALGSLEREHLASCATCAEQVVADEALRALFQDIEIPEVSPRFAGQLAQRLEEQRAQRSGSWRRRILGAYWLAAGAASAWILLDLQPVLLASASRGAGYFFLALVLISPLFALVDLAGLERRLATGAGAMS